MSYYTRKERVRRQHRKYDAIFGGIMTLAMIGAGFLGGMFMQGIFTLLGVG